MSYAPLPTTAQVVLTLEVISSKQRKIASAERQIQEYEARIAALRSEIATIQNEIASSESYLAPVRRLPIDILGEIVTVCATDPEAPVQVLRALASISRKWREATLRTPNAWTKITVQRLPAKFRQEGGPRQKLCTPRDVKEWLSRSGTCKKDVSLDWEEDSLYGDLEDETEDDNHSELAAIFSLLRSRASEIRSFTSNGYWDDEALPLQSMSSLQALDVGGLGDDEFVSNLAFSCPRLRCITTWGLSRGGPNQLVPLQSRIQVLVITRLPANDLFQLLRAGNGFVGLRALSVSCLATSWSIPDRSVISLFAACIHPPYVIAL
ncbi:hypothetical protein AURDEDRAFT_174912 [Auricularia subglabra TFB-10046 SS5]|uniref:F-box domain-containing protein n=1 Tax=Auricularia subglabra (strain TFB-10046 / SS5) TaxID=717982 RepID=J0D8U2_AURST|nr:hypothetical protein AURDEDRAFT_174912 [Auricularia subglabra TFB-10046 SS5]